SRCLSLANEMKRQGCGKIVFACRDSEDFKGKIESSGYKFVPIEAENTEQDAIKTAAAAYQEGAETIVVDTYGIDVDYLTYLKKRIEVLAVIDDNRLLGNYDVDVIVNQNLHAAKLDYSVSEGAEKLLGPKYAILRDEFGPSDFRREVGEAKRILVTFGASDMKGANPVCAEALKRLDGDKEFRFIIGRLTKKEELEKVIGDDKRFSLLQDISNMAEQIRWCDMMVLSPGTTTYEAIRFSTPGIFIVQAENQELVGDSINEKEVGLCLGKIEQLDSEKIYDALTTVSSEEERMKMISAMDEMVDGKGAERVAKAILSKVKKRL
ncbi:TPA: UDP-2,4-diacetamido-2,4,6-trideoxy-beta-L-altropyranose hydrolase, partial [Candidatus Micrarchaeota archaeon]|nr:UDP-2,4-diacetamido-2,4,6-trideoxy-beta-L-altropyranose hydrolase [Candidatus Micrarchaeota archaeon]